MSRNGDVNLADEEFYDEDDLEELDLDDDDAEDFDAEALSLDDDGRDLPDDDGLYVEGGERLHKVLAHAGVASRRMCEKLISQGRVTVDGAVVREAGFRVDTSRQEIRVDGTRVLTDPDVITVLLNKPAGVVCTMEDPQGRPTVADYGDDYLADHPTNGAVRLVHVGRLDTDTEGLLLLSNDGELSHRLMHPSYEIFKTYVAIVEGEVERWVPRKLQRGIELDDGPIKADKVTIKEAGPAGSILEITLHSGRNRIVRRMLAEVGHPVRRLVRTKLGPLALGGLKVGQMRALTSEEITALQEVVGL